MKKTQGSNRQNSKKQDYLSPTRFPKKEFEFIYREKQQLPSSEAYESIIFMKSKKCSNKSASTGKTTSKGNKNTSDHINKAFNSLEQQINFEQTNRNKKQDESSRPVILKNRLNKAGTLKKQVSSLLKEKTQKKTLLENNCQNTKKYKKIVSPSKHLKPKMSQMTTASTHFARSTQQNFRKNQEKQQNRHKKENRNNFSQLDLQEPEEYILLQNNFVGVAHKQSAVLEEKLISSRRDYNLDNRVSPRGFKNQYQAESPIFERQKTQHVFEEYLEYEDSSSTSNKNSFYQAQQDFSNNNLAVVQMYLVSKVKMIQRWWRKVSQKKQTCQLSKIEENLPESQIKVLEIESEKSIKFDEKQLINADFQNASPIKMIEEIHRAPQETNYELQAINSREIAAKAQRQAHNSILQKLLLSKKINAEVYIQKKDVIEARYNREIQETQQIRKVIKENAAKAVEMEKKTQQDLTLMQDANVQVDLNLLDKIFGMEEVIYQEEDNVLPEMPVLEEMIIQREKSTGCHFASEEKQVASLYKKEPIEEQQYYKQDFEEYGEGQTTPPVQGCKEIFQEVVCEQNSNNLKELYDEFKLRQQVKMEVDRRAALQMGIISENIAPEIKDQFVSIDTSLNSIHRFILAFFKYYVFYYKFDFLRLINMPFGFNIDKRIKILQDPSEELSPEEDEQGVIYGLQSVISEDIFQQFYEKVYQGENKKMSSAKLANFEFEKTHNKAIFDAFNEGLNFFRPYFQIDGPPFPWTNSQKALTFYFIAEENIQQVFEKTQFKVLKWASTLCGIIVDKYSSPVAPLQEHQPVESICQKYKKAVHPLVGETREQRMNKNQKLQMEDISNQWNIFQNQKTKNNLEVSQFLFNFIIDEFCLEFLEKKDDASSDFQIC